MIGLSHTLSLAARQPGGPPWVLANGAWNDAGVWDDTALWRDS